MLRQLSTRLCSRPVSCPLSAIATSKLPNNKEGGEGVPTSGYAKRNPENVHWTVEHGENKSRLDRFIKRRAPGLPPGLIQRLIRQGKVTVGGHPPRRNAHPVSTDDIVEVPGHIKLGLSRGKKKPPSDDTSLKEAEMVRTWVIHRDARCVVLNKPAGIATQGGTNMGERHVEAFLPGIGGGRYWLVHRLDKEVSGALIVARDVGAAGILSEHFRNQLISKTYWALVRGKPQRSSGVITADVAGKTAATAYRVLTYAGEHGTFLEMKPTTGRKHQLRVHCAEVLGTPIQGDAKYAGNDALCSTPPALPTGEQVKERIHLHARSIEFPCLTKRHGTSSETNTVTVEAPLPIDIKQYWEALGFH